MNEQIRTLLAAGLESITDSEVRAITEAIVEAGRPISQSELTQDGRWHEELGQRGIASGPMIRTPGGERRVREMVRLARVTFAVPICSGPTGYFIPQTWEQVDEFMARISGEAKARVVSSLKTAKRMRELFRRTLQDDFLDLLQEAVDIAETETETGNEEGKARGLAREIARVREENRWLKERIAKWGRPSNAIRLERQAEQAKAPTLFQP